MPANFGSVLDSRNIEASLAAWREERDDLDWSTPRVSGANAESGVRLSKWRFLQGRHGRRNSRRRLVNPFTCGGAPINDPCSSAQFLALAVSLYPLATHSRRLPAEANLP